MSVIVKSYDNLKNDFTKMIDQIKVCNLEEVDAWCSKLGAISKPGKNDYSAQGQQRPERDKVLPYIKPILLVGNTEVIKEEENNEEIKEN